MQLVLDFQNPGVMTNDDVSRNLFASEWNSIKGDYAGIVLIFKDGIPVLEGQLQLFDGAGLLRDSYLVEVHWQKYYPHIFPHLFEVGGRIPNNEDWHKFPKNGRCCLKTLPEELIRCAQGVTLADFMKTEVIPYFFAQSFRREHGYFLHERSHGTKGSIEFFEETFGTKDINLIADIITLISNGKEYKSSDKCFCGSGKKYEKCHRRQIRKLSALSPEIWKHFLKEIHSYLKVKNLSTVSS